MNTKPILYDLGVSIGAISLWLVPVDALRVVGYSTSFIFAGDAYLRGLSLISKDRKSEEKQAIAYESDVDFYDQLLGQTNEAKLEIAALEVETRMLERLIPLVERKNRLESRLNQMTPQHPELTDEQREDAARVAIDSAFPKHDDTPKTAEIDEEVIRKHFPEEMDSTYWKGICKALGSGLTRADIVKDVLGCSSGGQTDVGNAYFEMLKRRFLDG